MVYGVEITLQDLNKVEWKRFRLIKAGNYIEAQNIAEDFAKQILYNLNLNEILSIKISNKRENLHHIADEVRMEGLLAELCPNAVKKEPHLSFKHINANISVENFITALDKVVSDVYEMWEL